MKQERGRGALERLDGVLTRLKSRLPDLVADPVLCNVLLKSQLLQSAPLGSHRARSAVLQNILFQISLDYTNMRLIGYEKCSQLGPHAHTYC
jgi:hypothetical protein